MAAVSLGVFALAATAQAITGFGFALVAVPLLALVVDPAIAVVGTTVVGLALTGFAATAERHHVEWRTGVRITVTGLVGMPLGLLVLSRLGERPLQAVIAGVVSLLVVLLALRVPFPAGPATQATAGLLSGALLTSTGMNGPPLVMAVQALGLSPRRSRGTLQAIFCGQGLVAVAAFAVSGLLDPLVGVVVAAGAAGVPLGWRVGDRLFGLVAPDVYRRLVLAMLTATALVALWTVLT
ncbi:sulfite exporter TauE/SafE family protein [Blastococcus goldschmidtiae]|uniref:Probable membrane transporter protein n=1 Tax=Blastococcus goldschmidtiae TaxID=3075546 RepID=A0ABU2K6W7_9ACTN|nr:sulfite exporter TauE/SafE family protein [Blastococcus sp. DSM 46792]MDT0275923.1 sulfite exporter TauE/SafE family protein [Blastococcus sp. DSM 46792]